jgi:hypothetical protein
VATTTPRGRATLARPRCGSRGGSQHTGELGGRGRRFCPLPMHLDPLMLRPPPCTCNALSDMCAMRRKWRGARRWPLGAPVAHSRWQFGQMGQERRDWLAWQRMGSAEGRERRPCAMGFRTLVPACPGVARAPKGGLAASVCVRAARPVAGVSGGHAGQYDQSCTLACGPSHL